MNELDLLKMHWQKDDDYIKFKKEDIISMVHKSSTSIVKWIFIICCIELLLGLSLGFINGNEESKPIFLKIIFIIADIVFYVVTMYFIYRFYLLLKQITNYSDTRYLLRTIIDVRENADKYIKFNILCFFITFIMSCISTIYLKYSEQQSWGEQIFYGIAFGIIMTLVWLLCRKIIKLYYKLVYGILLKKLNKNYEELIELDK